MLGSVKTLEAVLGSHGQPQLRKMVTGEQRKEGASTQPYRSST